MQNFMKKFLGISILLCLSHLGCNKLQFPPHQISLDDEGNDGFSSLALSHQGDQFAIIRYSKPTPSYDKTVEVWGIDSGKKLFSLPMPATGVSTLTWSPQGTYVAISSDALTLWQPQSGLSTTLDNVGLQQVRKISFVSDSQLLLATVILDANNTMRAIGMLVSISSDSNGIRAVVEKTFEGTTDFFVDAKNTLAAIIPADHKSVLIWDLIQKRSVTTIPWSSKYSPAAFSSSSGIVVIEKIDRTQPEDVGKVFDFAIKKLDLQTGTPVSTQVFASVTVQLDWADSLNPFVYLSKDGSSLLFLSSGVNARVGTYELWDLNTLKKKYRNTVGDSCRGIFAVSPDFSKLFSEIDNCGTKVDFSDVDPVVGYFIDDIATGVQSMELQALPIKTMHPNERHAKGELVQPNRSMPSFSGNSQRIGTFDKGTSTVYIWNL